MIIKFIGHCATNFCSSLKFFFSGRLNFSRTVQRAAEIGFDSMLMVVLISTIAGAVFSIQISTYFSASGADDYIGATIGIALIREIAPVFAALAISARVGTSMAAEIANMKVTDQLNAMKVMRVDPIEYTVAPRILASAIMTPMSVILATFAGIIGGIKNSQLSIMLHPERFLTSLWTWLEPRDIYISLIKAFIFGIVIVTISCSWGLLAKGGAKGVGTATTKAAIYSAVAVLILDYFLTWAFYA